jgi:hypothetical protein
MSMIQCGVEERSPRPGTVSIFESERILFANDVEEARVNMGRIAAEQLIDALDGKPPSRVVNPEVWPLYAQRFERTLGFAPRQR